MNNKHIQLEQYHVHTGLTKAEGVLLATDSIEKFATICIKDLVVKKIAVEDAKISLDKKYLEIVKIYKEESDLLIAFAKENVILYHYEIPILKLLVSPATEKALFERMKAIEKVFKQELDYRLQGYDREATKDYYKNL